MRALETARLIIRAFTLADGDTYSRLLEAAFGADSSGSAEDRRIIFEYQVAADPGLALLHQPPYGDRAIVLRDSGEVVGSVGYAACLMPFGLLPSFETTTRFTSEIGLFWALFPEHQGRGYATEAPPRWCRTHSRSCDCAASWPRPNTTTRGRSTSCAVSVCGSSGIQRPSRRGSRRPGSWTTRSDSLRRHPRGCLTEHVPPAAWGAHVGVAEPQPVLE